MREAPAHHRDRLSELPAPRCAAVFVRGRVCSSLSHAAAARVLQTAVPRAEALPLLRPSAARMARAAPRAAALAAVKKVHNKSAEQAARRFVLPFSFCVQFCSR